jgi:hypothetical protein
MPGWGLGWLVPAMLRLCLRIIALIAIVTCSSMTAQAADTTLTLSCKGKQTSGVGERKSSEVTSA